MILGLFGKSCNGKTSSAKFLSSLLQWEVRHCGSIVSERAAELGRSPSQLSQDDHRAIDEETRRLVSCHATSLIIEGCFLDHVLRETPRCVLVQLDCDQIQRELRHASRGLNLPLSTRDDADAALRKLLYTDELPRRADVCIDTSDLDISTTAERVLQWLERQSLLPQRG